MAPSSEQAFILENPVRDAAIHFGAFLQQKGMLYGGNEEFGNIEINNLKDQFINHYQPQFHSYLVLPELLPTLRKYRVIPRKSRRRPDRESTAVRVTKHPHPEQVRPPPDSVPRQRIYVDHNRVLRDQLVRSDVVNEAKCRLCNVSFFNDESKREHVDSDLHKFKLQYREKRSSFKSAVGGASIAVVEPASDVEIILREGERKTFTVRVTLDAPYAVANIFKIIDLGQVEASPLEFKNDAPIEIRVTAMFHESGAYIFPLVAKIMPNRICLLKDLIFRVESELMDTLAPVSPFIMRQDVIREMEGSILPGEYLDKTSRLGVQVFLGTHTLPTLYNKLVLHKLERYDDMTPREEDSLNNVLGLLCGLKTYREALCQVSQTKLPFNENLDHDNYSERFRLLVDLEELQQQREIKNYDRSNQTLQRGTTRFTLQMPDLSEGRPSVIKGDHLHVRLQGNDKITYEGIVHELQEHGLVLGFHREFQTEYMKIENTGVKPKVDVRFTVNRFPILNMHRALTLMSKHNAYSIVFPQRSKSYHPPSNPSTNKLKWVNTLIGSNPEQQKAVQKIISKSSGNVPYLVFGPPGTGKTVTLVETICQVWLAKGNQKAKQLVCAPSNAACNNVAERLIRSLPEAKILRLLSVTLETAHMSDILLAHSNFDQERGCPVVPTLNEIVSHDIIIVTIVTAGRLVTGGASGAFKFVYIDECGQATEPEALIAIAGLLTTKRSPSVGQLVLAGDPEQLGPVLSSQLAVDFGLGMSLLERLMKQNSLYKKTEGSGYDSNYLTKLVQNFRSHPAILHLPNQLFYEGELETKGNPDIINKALGWEELPNKDFPLIFHGIQGIDERESNSPSYFNRQEIDQVIKYMKKLLTNGLPNNCRVRPEDIGVISPYRAQVQKFRKAFQHLNWENIKVGSVEEFQGSEKLIIFISTVRSTIALVDEDYRFRLGFLKNPKRFNVSVTRAQALLIVVGNPNILWHDKHWYQLINYCSENRAVVGINLPRDDLPDHLSQQLHISG